MSGKEFERVDMNEARFRDVDLGGARFERVNLSGADDAWHGTCQREDRR
jgi:uncharacterized protein YjbI with pentapeptide repeats